MNKRLFALSALLSLILAGCGDSTGTDVQTTGIPEDTAVTVTEDAAPRDGLPEELDFGGAEVKIHSGLWMGISKDPLSEYYVEKETGDIVNDAVYNRNRAVEERLNVKFSHTWHETTWETRATELAFYTSSIMSGDDFFDIVFYIAHLMPSVALGGSMYNLADMEYIDLSQPWWAQLYNGAATVNGNLYFATGDIVLGNYLNAYCMYFNHQLIGTLDMENPYELVKNGKWTLETVRTMSAEAYSDLNGNAKADEGDRFGLVVQGGNIISGFMESSEVQILEIADDGLSGEYVFANEHNTNVVQRVCKLLFESEGVLYGKDGTADQYLFNDGNVVFTGGWFSDTDYYRDLEFDYGVIPYPKYDENQDDYYTRMGTACPVVAVPVTTDDPDMISAVLEVMAAEGYYQMRPAYFDTALKNKYSRDEETKDMVDRIISNVTVDFGTIYVYILNDISDKFKSMIGQNNANWASGAEKWEKSTLKNLETLLATLNNT